VLTTVAEAGGIVVGFCCTFYAHDQHGSYLDNLHVAPEYQQQGVGKQLLADAARRVAQRDPDGDIYLLVLTSNAQAITFYQRMQGRFGEIKTKDLAGTEVEVVAVHWGVKALVTR
jgi:ribosomal protein S18 acetylase RimI-like enzyme